MDQTNNMAAQQAQPKEEPQFFNADFLFITITAVVLQAFVMLYFYTFVV
jgi:hypothetical protein